MSDWERKRAKARWQRRKKKGNKLWVTFAYLKSSAGYHYWKMCTSCTINVELRTVSCTHTHKYLKKKREEKTKIIPKNFALLPGDVCFRSHFMAANSLFVVVVVVIIIMVVCIAGSKCGCSFQIRITRVLIERTAMDVAVAAATVVAVVVDFWHVFVLIKLWITWTFSSTTISVNL